jgi:hypothetical protein
MNHVRMVLLGLFLALLATACGSLMGTPEEAGGADLPDDVATAAKEALSAETDVSVEKIEVVEAEEREWPNACLGLAEEGEACAQVITPGWRVTLRVDGETYVLRTDEEGTAVRVEE